MEVTNKQQTKVFVDYKYKNRVQEFGCQNLEARKRGKTKTKTSGTCNR